MILRRSPNRRGFTLIELLAVVAIMGIVIAISIPYFQGMGRGTGMKTAVENVRSTLALARQWAITHRETTYVVFPDQNLVAGLPEHLGKAYKAYNAYTPSEGYLGEWKFLPTGVIFDPDYEPDFNVINNANDYTLVVGRVGFPTRGNLRDVWAIAFRPDGSVKLDGNFTSTVEIFLTEGWTTTSGGMADLTYKPGPAGSRIVRSIEIWPWTGQLKRLEYPNE